MSAALPLRAMPSAMPQFPSDPEIALLYGRNSELDARRLAVSLRAKGHHALLVPASPQTCAEALEEGGPPLLLVSTADEVDTPVLRSRLARALDREHSWLPRPPAGCDAGLLVRQICAGVDALRREQTPVTPKREAVRAELEPSPPPPSEPRSRPAWASRAPLLVWPLVGAMAAAIALAAFGPPQEDPPSDPLRPSTLQPSAVADPPVDPPPAPAAVAPKRRALPTPATPPSSEQVAVGHERVTEAAGSLVYVADERPRDWYAAMNLCRGRTLAGLRGWKTPSAHQLHALAKQRVLPPMALWSRTRSLHAQDVAFVVQGHAGTTRSALKQETVDGAVCIRASTPDEE